MMEFLPIIHKVNTIDKLKTIPVNYGVEIDIRFENKYLYLSHDPIVKLDSVCMLQDFLSEFNHKFLVANVKDAGIEAEVINTIREVTENFFLLDFEIPFLFKKNKDIKKFLSARYSLFEKVNRDSLIVDYVEWLWVDSYEELPINKFNLNTLPILKKCLVSPERWGREEDITEIADFMLLNELNFELIMTNINTVDIWKKALKSENKK